MKKQLHIRFGKNLKFLREKHQLTQATLAEKIGRDDKKVHKRIGSYEQGLAFPSPELMKNILDHFQVKYEHMVNKNLARMNDKEFRNLSREKKTELQVLTISVSEDNTENIEMVPHAASAGYIRGFADGSYIRKLDKFHMPWLPPEATYRAFEISGDSMPPD